MLAKLKFAILLLVVISFVALIQGVEGASPVHVGVPGAPIHTGSSFQITFYIDHSYCTTCGSATVYVRTASSFTHIWEGSSFTVSGGLDYEVTAPGISTPGSYVAGVVVIHGGAVLGETAFSVIGSGSGSTDWSILSVTPSPPNPHVGDPVIFMMEMTALSSSGAFPQSFNAECLIDGATCGGGFVSYPGPAGTQATVNAATPWTATPGTHTLTWSISTAGDPNTSNNVMSISFTVTSPTPFDFSISASPSQQAVAPGGGTSFTVTVNLVSGPPQNVALTLSGAPAGVSGTFSPTSGTSSFSSTLNVVTTSAASPGTFPLTITGSGGGVTHTVQVALTVSQAPDFQIAVSPASQSALQGQTVSYSVNVVALNGFNSQVSLSVSGLPSGANGAFSIAIGTPNFASTLTVTLPTNIPTGSFTLTVTATGGGLSKVANMGLTISQALATQTPPTETSSTQAVTNLPGMSDLMTMLQQNSLLLLVLLIALVAIVGLASRHRKPSGPQQGTRQAEPGTKFCTKCGTPNPIGNEFCGKCGTKL